MSDDNDDYEAIRQKNISERNMLFAELFKDIKKQSNELKQLKTKQVKKFDEESSNTSDSENRLLKVRKRQSRKRNIEFCRTYNTRSRTRTSGTVSYDKTEKNNRKTAPSRLKVLFPWAKPAQRYIDMMKVVCDVDEEQEEETDSDSSYAKDSKYKTQKRYKARAICNPASVLLVNEITQEMLDNIADKSTEKQYCKRTGTSCHQCRQKTLDTKTICRSGKCIGTRGQFCGPCLKLRYGEDAADALKDPNWACPSCRGLCNCSICRTKNGLAPTGVLAPFAEKAGFSSVLTYLQARGSEDEDTSE